MSPRPVRPRRPRSRSDRPTAPAPWLSRLWSETADRQELPNGLTVLHRPDHSSALLSVQVWVKTGSIHEGALLGHGLSHYLEHLLFQGTARRSGPEINRAAQEAGGYLNAYTTFDRTVYHLDLPSEHAELAFDLLADMVFGSTLPEPSIEQERGIILREIDMGMDDPDRRLSQAVFETAFRQHPCRLPVIGHRDLFSRVRREDLLAYHQARYVPDNCVLAVAGDLTPERLTELLDRTFAPLPRRGLAPVPVPSEPPQLAGRERRLTGEVNLDRAVLGFRIPGLAHADAPALDLLCTLLGRGNSSLLWLAIRDRDQLVHQIDASAWNPGEGGLCMISFLCDPPKRERAEEAILRELDRIAQRGFTADQLDKARRQALAAEVNSRKTMSGLASRLGLAEVVIGDLDYLRRYFDRLGSVQPEDLAALFPRYLHGGGLSRVSLSPRGASVTRSAATPAAPLPDFTLTTLPNGARLLLQPDARLPRLHFRVAGLGGPFVEDPAHRGLTALMSNLMTKDTATHSASEVADRIESLGGSWGEFVGNNSFNLALELFPGDASAAREILDGALCQPAFLPETVALEREAQIADLRESLDEITEFARLEIRRRFFTDHPFASESLGSVETVQALTPELVRAHHARLITGPNLVLSVAGDFDPARLGPALADWLGRFPSHPGPASAPPYAGPPEPLDAEVFLPREQAVVMVGYPDCGLRDPLYRAGEILDEVFGDSSGELFLSVRERHRLAYFVGATRLTGLQTGLFLFFAGTHPDTAGEVLRLVEAEVQRILAGGLTRAEFERCRTRLKAGRRSSLQVLGARAMQAALDTLYGLTPNEWRRYDEQLDRITPEDVQAFAARCFNPARRVRLTVRPPPAVNVVG